jgi:hypothetical protein
MLRDRDDPEHADRDHHKPDQRRHGADLGAQNVACKYPIQDINLVLTALSFHARLLLRRTLREWPISFAESQIRMPLANLFF